MRGSYGFQEVRAVMLRSDCETIDSLRDFTEQALKLSGTGRLKKLESWLSGTYAESFKHRFMHPSPWCQKPLKQPASKQMRSGSEGLKAATTGPRRKQGMPGLFAFQPNIHFSMAIASSHCSLHLILQSAASQQAGMDLMHAAWTHA